MTDKYIICANIEFTDRALCTPLNVHSVISNTDMMEVHHFNASSWAEAKKYYADFCARFIGF